MYSATTYEYYRIVTRTSNSSANIYINRPALLAARNWPSQGELRQTAQLEVGLLDLIPVGALWMRAVVVSGLARETCPATQPTQVDPTPNAPVGTSWGSWSSIPRAANIACRLCDAAIIETSSTALLPICPDNTSESHDPPNSEVSTASLALMSTPSSTRRRAACTRLAHLIRRPCGLLLHVYLPIRHCEMERGLAVLVGAIDIHSGINGTLDPGHVAVLCPQ